MPTARRQLTALVVVLLFAFAIPCHMRAQAALLMEEPYGFFGALNPTGHTAVYFARICTDNFVKVRRCEAGELGSVIGRYQGIAGYDWIAMPLIPYLYSLEDADKVPDRVDPEIVTTLRRRYHEQHLTILGDVPEGNLVHGGWAQLVGVAYERRIFAFRFATTEAQDNVLIEKLNEHKNDSHFDLLYGNCADWARVVMNGYFPRTFRRTIFPDAGMTTPRQITYKLVKYAKKHPEVDLTVFEIPQIPGYRRLSRANKSVAGSLITTGYAVPITIMSPYLAGGILVDYLVRGRYPLVPEHPSILKPTELAELQSSAGDFADTPAETSAPSGTIVSSETESQEQQAESPGMKETLDQHGHDAIP